MPLGFWDEPGRYESTYWAHWPGRWRHGDWAEITEDGYWFIHGRSDDTLTIAGKRVGPAEVEDIANENPDVIESVAIGVPHEVTGEALVLYVRLKPGAVDGEAARAALVASIIEQLGKPMRPNQILFVDDLPRTASGKVLRRVVRGLHLDPNFSAPLSLENPESVSAVQQAR